MEGELRAEAQRHQTNLSGAIDNNYGNPFFEAVLSEALSILLRFGPMSFADATLDLKGIIHYEGNVHGQSKNYVIST